MLQWSSMRYPFKWTHCGFPSFIFKKMLKLLRVLKTLKVFRWYVCFSLYLFISMFAFRKHIRVTCIVFIFRVFFNPKKLPSQLAKLVHFDRTGDIVVMLPEALFTLASAY